MKKKRRKRVMARIISLSELSQNDGRGGSNLLLLFFCRPANRIFNFIMYTMDVSGYLKIQRWGFKISCRDHRIEFSSRGRDRSTGLASDAQGATPCRTGFGVRASVSRTSRYTALGGRKRDPKNRTPWKVLVGGPRTGRATRAVPEDSPRSRWTWTASS